MLTGQCFPYTYCFNLYFLFVGILVKCIIVSYAFISNLPNSPMFLCLSGLCCHPHTHPIILSNCHLYPGGSNTHTSILLGRDTHTCLCHHKYEQWHLHTGPAWVWVRVSLGCPSGAELMVPVPSDPDWLHWATFCYVEGRPHLLTTLDLIQPLNYISLRCVRWRPPVFTRFSDFCQIWGSVPMITSPLGFLFY